MKKKKIILVICICLAVLGLLGWKIFYRKNKDDKGTVKIESIRLLLISEKTYRPGVANIGDIVGIFEGEHEFSPAEYASFDILTIQGVSKLEAENYLSSLLPPTSGLIEDEIADRYNQPKYKFRVTDKNGTTLDKMTATNVTLKQKN